jgi:hypothetical protein
MFAAMFAGSVALLGAITPSVLAQDARTVPKPSAEDTDRHDCPGPWLEIKPLKDKDTPTSGPSQKEVKVAGPQSSVPEFHDCQRFLSATNRTYEGLYAVFADTTPPATFTARATANLEFAYLAGEVVTRDGFYPQLKVKPLFNCLYLAAGANWRAFMFAAGTSEDSCADSVPVKKFGRYALSLRRVIDRRFGSEDYPPSARWDRTPAGAYYVVMSCGLAVCEIGIPKGQQSSIAQTAPDTMSAGEKRVRLIKPWYDEQIVAIPGKLNAMPTTVLGVAIPDPNLQFVRRRQFESGWVKVGEIELSMDQPRYTSQLGLERGKNTMYLRHRPSDRDTLWQAMMVTETKRVTYGKVTRYPHEGMGFHIPATLRWRWMSNDETIWARCLEGCCQVEQGFTPTPP